MTGADAEAEILRQLFGPEGSEEIDCLPGGSHQEEELRRVGHGRQVTTFVVSSRSRFCASTFRAHTQCAREFRYVSDRAAPSTDSTNVD